MHRPEGPGPRVTATMGRVPPPDVRRLAAAVGATPTPALSLRTEEALSPGLFRDGCITPLPSAR
jgi:hypothetical protein